MIQPKYDPLLDIIRSQDTAEESGKLKFDPIMGEFRMSDLADGFNVDPISGQLRHATLLNPLPPEGAIQFEDSLEYIFFEWDESEEYITFETIE